MEESDAYYSSPRANVPEVVQIKIESYNDDDYRKLHQEDLSNSYNSLSDINTKVEEPMVIQDELENNFHYRDNLQHTCESSQSSEIQINKMDDRKMNQYANRLRRSTSNFVDYSFIMEDNDSTNSMNLPEFSFPSTSVVPSTSSILNGNFFKVVEEKGSSVTATCVKCEPNIIKIKGVRNSSSNFISHLKRRHGPDVLAEYEQFSKNIKTNAQSAYTKNINKTKKEISQKEFDEHMTRFIIHSIIPLGIVDDTYFKKLLQYLEIEKNGLCIISRQSLGRRIDTIYSTMIGKIKNELSTATHVCMSADIWTSEKFIFFCVTSHWIYNNFERKSAALACRRLKEIPSSNKISEMLQNIHGEYNLDSSKIVATITNNVGNFKKEFRMFGITGILTDDGNESDDSVYEIEIENKEIPSIPCRLKCAVYTLSLCASVDIIKNLQTNPDALDLHQNILRKCNLLWKTANKPKTAEILQNILGHALICPNDTSWNSYYDSLSQIIKIKRYSKQIYEALKYKNGLKENDFCYIEEYLMCTKPIVEAIDILQKEKNSFYGILVPCLLALRKKMEELSKKDWTFSRHIINSLIVSINKRFYNFYHFTTTEAENAAVAALTHPKFKKRWFTCLNKNKQDNLLCLAKQAIIQVTNLDKNEDVINVTQFEDEDNFFDFGDASDESQMQQTLMVKAELDILRFFEDRDSTLLSLNKHPVIKKVFIKYNTPLPSSALVVRLFSFDSIINLATSNTHVDDKFEKRVILKTNLNYE